MRKVFVAASLAVVVLSGVHPSHAAVSAVVAGPGNSASSTYTTPVAVLAKAGPMNFVNVDIEEHNVVASTAAGSRTGRPWCPATGFCPLFWSAVISTGGTTPILGLSNVAQGSSYEFLCVVHPNMKGTIVVV